MKIFKVKIHYKNNGLNTVKTAAADDTLARQKAVTADRNDYRGLAKKDVPIIDYCETELLAETSD